MSTLYRPVLIETAEQAEALPDAAIVVGDETGERYLKNYGGKWWGITEMAGPLSQDVKYDKIVALVPIEAEEEWALVYGGEDPTPCIDEVDAREWGRIDGEGQAPSHRLVTPWESV